MAGCEKAHPRQHNKLRGVVIIEVVFIDCAGIHIPMNCYGSGRATTLSRGSVLGSVIALPPPSQDTA
jgi:hypothetical protein